MTDRQPPLDRFFGVMSPSAVLYFFAAVFFIFAPVGVLCSSSIEQDRPAWLVGVLFLLGGTIAVCWAGLFTISRWFLPGIVVTSAAMFALSTWASRFDPNDSIAGRFPVWISVALIIVGYTLFLSFISGQGRNTLRVMTEMSLARSIHHTLVPPIEITERNFEALGSSVASSEMGGDLIDVVRGTDHIDLFIADVSGHGVKAGVVMGMIKAAMRTSLRRGGTLDVTLSELNDVLEQITSPELYATAVGLRIEANRLAYTFAGHHRVLLWRAASREVEHLHQSAAALGMFGAQRYATTETQLAAGDLIAVYTDGLNETMDENDEELGHEVIERRIAEIADQPLEQIQRAVFDLVMAHGNRTDDQTLLLLRHFGPRA